MYLYKLLVALFFLAVNTCEDPSAEAQNKTKTLYIDAQLADCEGVGPQKCMKIKENPDEQWSLFYDGIEGFDFQEGYTYQIKVQITPVTNPMADASSLHYKLIKVLSKEKITGTVSSFQTENLNKLHYKAYTRGFSKEMTILPEYIIKTENGKSDTIPMDKKNWQALTILIKNSEPETWGSISPPSTKFSTDAALHTTLSATFPSQQFATQTFDEHNPPKKLKSLIQRVRTLANDME